MAAYIGRIQDADGADVYPQVKKAGIVDFPTDLLKRGDIKYSDWSDEGLVLLNGAQKYFPGEKNRFGYQYAQLPGFKIIHIRAEIKINIKSSIEVVKLPNLICPDGSIQRPGKANGEGFFTFAINDYDDNKKITILNYSNNANWYSINATYLKKD